LIERSLTKSGHRMSFPEMENFFWQLSPGAKNADLFIGFHCAP
jgi:hypothetical protein